MQSYAEKDGGEPKTYTIELGWKLLSIARQTGCLDEVDSNAWTIFGRSSRKYHQDGMTEKNMAVIRQVMTASVWSEVRARSRRS